MASVLPMSSAIPTSRRRARRIRANASTGRFWRGTAWHWRGRTGCCHDSAFAEGLARFGYDVSDPSATTRAFQRRFRQEKVDGAIDAETRAILATLLESPDSALPWET